jgi:hypothetical protein
MKAHKVVRRLSSHILSGSKIAIRVSALCAGHPLPPGRFLILIPVRGWVDPRAIVQPEWLIELKKKIHFIGTRTCNLPACSIVPQPDMLFCAHCTNLNTSWLDIVNTKIIDVESLKCNIKWGKTSNWSALSWIWNSHRNLKSTIFCNVTPCIVLQVHQRFGDVLSPSSGSKSKPKEATSKM